MKYSFTVPDFRTLLVGAFHGERADHRRCSAPMQHAGAGHISHYASGPKRGALGDRPAGLSGGCRYAILVAGVASGKADVVIWMMCRLAGATERVELAMQSIGCLVADAVKLQRGFHPLPYESPWRRHDYFGPCSIASSPWGPTGDAVDYSVRPAVGQGSGELG